MMNLPLPNNRLNKLATVTQSDSGKTKTNASHLKKLPLNEFLQPLVTAMHQRQPWVDDFCNDQIMLPVDLYEVIKEFTRLQTKNKP